MATSKKKSVSISARRQVVNHGDQCKTTTERHESLTRLLLIYNIYKNKKYNIATERAEEFKYLGTTLTNQNSIQEEIKSRLKNYNFACCFVWM